MNYYRHNKTGHIYEYMREAIDATNGHDDKKMVVYHNQEGLTFVRERDEFHAKFTALSPDESVDQMAREMLEIASHPEMQKLLGDPLAYTI